MPRIHVGSLIVDYTEAGIGAPIVFIPGLTEFKEAFVFQYRGLQDNYRVIGYDVRHGLKRSADYTLELLVSDLYNFLKAIGLDGAVICGHSFGGLVAMQFARQYPDLARALILVSSFASAPPVSPSRLTGWLSSAGHPLHRSLGTVLKLHLARLKGRQSTDALTMEHQVAAVKDIAEQATQLASTTVRQRVRIIENTDLRSALSEIIAPTLVVAGSKDRGVLLSSAQQLYEGIPDSTLEVIEGGGHFCFLTRHDDFNSAVDDFLSVRLASI